MTNKAQTLNYNEIAATAEEYERKKVAFEKLNNERNATDLHTEEYIRISILWHIAEAEMQEAHAKLNIAKYLHTNAAGNGETSL